MKHSNHYIFIEDVKKVLEYTTAVPFKTRSSRNYCVICSTNRDSFDHPSELREHMKEHDHEIQEELDRVLRPQFMNEILRVDVEVFGCKVCSVKIETWNDMFKHLSETHDIDLTEAYTRLIPYRLSSDTKFTCALCSEVFPNFQYIDAHMNAHYCNYMCSECGDTFVTECRLKHHEQIHNTGKFPCKFCGKVFSLEKYKKKHEAMVHAEFKMFKCVDCGEQFQKEIDRHLHTVEAHPHKMRISTCEFCGKQFNWKPYYLAHLRKAHSTFKQHPCSYCSKRFVTKFEKKSHEQRHTGDGKFVCFLCRRHFVTAVEMRKHAQRHFTQAKLITPEQAKMLQIEIDKLGDDSVALEENVAE